MTGHWPLADRPLQYPLSTNDWPLATRPGVYMGQWPLPTSDCNSSTDGPEGPLSGSGRRAGRGCVCLPARRPHHYQENG